MALSRREVGCMQLTRRKQNPVANPLSLLCSRNPKSSRNPNSWQSLLSGPVWKSCIFQFGKCTRLSPSGKDGEVCQYQYQLLHFPVCKVPLDFHQLEGKRGGRGCCPSSAKKIFYFSKLISTMKNKIMKFQQ